jgi:D-alanyl-lipoteichoic acid acyltransferase DltB (MBOAT superfamily)
VIDWLTPGPLHNELIAPTPLSGPQVYAGPFGLLAYLLFIPFTRMLARIDRAAAISLTGLGWLIATLGPAATVKFLGCVAAGAAWVILLGTLRRRSILGRRGMIALVWVGLHAMVFPLWLWPSAFAYGWDSPPVGPNGAVASLAVLHALGLAYFLFRFIAWGVDWANDPLQPLRPAETLAWIFYPPIMRLGPLMTRQVFLERFEVWRTTDPIRWREVGRHFGWFLAGGVVLGVILRNRPTSLGVGRDFFAAPELYSTSDLVSLIYLIPIQVLLMLWLYNELAAITSKLVGIPADNNFDNVPAATSLRDFWRRWHITVGAWLRTYVFFPLGGSRRRAELNYILTFAYCGVWHGAAWSFLAWGVLQGVGLSVQRWWDALVAKLGRADAPPTAVGRWLGWFLTMNFTAATIFMFTDFEYAGLRVFRELARRAGLLP